ncbi:MAG: PDZ domain-containing protein [Pseudomonadota bacterium]
MKIFKVLLTLLASSAVLVTTALAQPMMGPYGMTPHGMGPMHGRHSGPALGVGIQAVPFERLAELELEYGLAITGVAPGGPADRAGLRAGDIITALDDQPVYSAARLQWLVRQAAAREQTVVSYVREGQMEKAEVSFARPEPSLPSERSFPLPLGPSNAYLGIRMQPLTEDLRDSFGAPEKVGVLISGIDEDSPGAEAGLKAGDVIVRMDRKTIRTVADVRRVTNYFDPGDTVEIEVIRDKKTEVLSATLAERPTATGRSTEEEWRRYFGEAFPYPKGLLNNLDELMRGLEDYWGDFDQQAPRGPAPPADRQSL